MSYPTTLFSPRKGWATGEIMNNMPDWTADDDDDEWIEPYYNDTGEFGETVWVDDDDG